MTDQSNMQSELRIERAKQGDEASLGSLLSTYERYLTILTEVQIGRTLQGKVDACDIVQETFLEAHRSIRNFQGTESYQFVAWLKSILSARLANTMRYYFGTQARDLRLEERIQAELDQSAVSFGGILIDPNSSPSEHISNEEQSRLVAESLLRLPDHYRQAILLRHIEGLSFPEIAAKMERSVDSVEKLWLRGMAQLKNEFSKITLS
jgi:RNA polymerase sigma-70 factor, ECF subfamily